MTIPKLSITSDQIHSGAKFETADGKTVTLNAYCIQEGPSRVSLSDAKIGDTIVTRAGWQLKIKAISVTPGGKFFGEPVPGSGGGKTWFYDDGSTNCWDSESEAVELIPCAAEPRVALGKTLPAGTEIRLRNGIVCHYRGLSATGSGNHIFMAPSGVVYFKPDGAAVTDDEAWEVVEVRKPALPDLVRTQLAKLNKADIERIVVNPKDRGLFGPLLSPWEGLQVKTNDLYRVGEFVIVFKGVAQ